MANFGRDDFPDCKLCLQDCAGKRTEIHCHRAILATAPYFKALFGRTQPSIEIISSPAFGYHGVYQIEVPVPFLAVLTIIEQLYATDDLGVCHLEPNTEDAVELLHAALFLGVDPISNLECALLDILAPQFDKEALFALISAVIQSDALSELGARWLTSYGSLLTIEQLRELPLEMPPDFWPGQSSSVPGKQVVLCGDWRSDVDEFDAEGLTWKYWADSDGKNYTTSFWITAKPMQRLGHGETEHEHDTALLTEEPVPHEARLAELSLTIFDPFKGPQTLVGGIHTMHVKGSIGSHTSSTRFASAVPFPPRRYRANDPFDPSRSAYGWVKSVSAASTYRFTVKWCGA